MGAHDERERMIAQNKRARFEYHVLEELECGVVLQGTEVKSLRQGRCSIQAAWGQVRGSGLWLVAANIPEYVEGNVHNHKPDRDRKLLAKQREIEAWHAQVKEKGTTIIPLAIYFKGSRVKVLLALCKGKKLHDKREDKREKDDRREMGRAVAREQRRSVPREK